MYELTIPMALFDYVPVILFGWAAFLLQRDLYRKMSKYAFACLAAGTINAFLSGFLKATWKLLYAAGICDFYVLNDLFLPLQSIGLLLAGLGIVMMLTARRKAMLAVAPPLFSGSFIFIAMMVLGRGVLCIGLSVVAARMKKKNAIVLLVLCFVAGLGMGYLSSRGNDSALANWLSQGINCASQLLFLGGVMILHKAGLRDLPV